METTVTGLPSENRINELMKAMSFVSQAKTIIYKEYPDLDEIKKNKEYYDAMFEVENDCNRAILKLSQAIGALVSYDLAGKY